MTAFSVRDLSIVDWQFRAAIVVVFLAVLVSSWLWLRRPLFRWTARALCLPVDLAFVAASINAHYDYFPTLGTVFGRTAADQISPGAFLQLEQSSLHRVLGRHHQAAHVNTPTPPLPSRGVVIGFSIPATVSHFPARTGQVYLPPAWFASPHPHLPVIELLHGSPGSPADWTRAGGADRTADKYAETHNGEAPILVMPDVNGKDWWHDSECVDGPQGNAETYLTTDVRHAVVRAFAARADGDSWAIAGLSEGGSCALQIGLRHPELFRVVGDFSGDDHPWVRGGLRQLFWGHTLSQLLRAEQSYDPRTILSRWHAADPPAIVFSAGRADSLVPRLERLLIEARRDHITATLDIFAGGHTFWLWNESFARTLPWIMQHLAEPEAPRLATSRTPSCARTPTGTTCEHKA
jgi:S-formylglutathione hydrolase FrmB